MQAVWFVPSGGLRDARSDAPMLADQRRSTERFKTLSHFSREPVQLIRKVIIEIEHARQVRACGDQRVTGAYRT